MPSLWEKFKQSGVNKKVLSPAWNALNYEALPEFKTGNKYADLGLELLVPRTPLGAALTFFPAGRAAKFLKRGVTAKAAGKLPPAHKIPATLRDEAKQIAMTFGVPGTGLSSHGIALAAAHLKSTPVKKLPKEAYETTRMLWNPNRAVKANDALTGGFSPNEVRNALIAQIKQLNPGAPDGQIRQAANRQLEFYAQNQAAGTRFKDILDLENSGFRTADIYGGTSKGISEHQLVTRPVKVGGVNVNPFSYQKELFDTPLFGEKGINEYMKRTTALDELDRLRKLGSSDAHVKANKVATAFLGGYGKENPGLFSSELAKWALTAPDWTRRHFDLLSKKAKSFTTQLRNPEYHPYRRAAGYDVAGLAGTMGATYGLTGNKPDRATDVFNVQMPGEYAGKTGVIRPWSTEMDLPKTAVDISNAAIPGTQNWYGDETKGLGAISQFWKYRIHPFSRSVLDAVQGTDWKGGRTQGEEQWAKFEKEGPYTVHKRPDIPLGEEYSRTFSNSLRNILPQAWDAAQKKINTPEKISDEEFYSQMGELPLSFYTPKYAKRESPIDQWMKSQRNSLRPRSMNPF